MYEIADAPALETGKIYYIPPERSTEIWAYLDHREKDGYTQRTVDVYGTTLDGQEYIVEKDVSLRKGDFLLRNED